ncbi:collagen alpha-1(I) chain-like [Hippopotamus amphibius kiboko]|uniref:collagen alpha-1(I) chain-like n=1 Tax=Hippopotamus amphibius kiboko TaxID=575201 RepID=UPI002596BFEB|nr:collagen alpha-1(I) chain-like [Hippopotamus amphibius kiboko]
MTRGRPSHGREGGGNDLRGPEARTAPRAAAPDGGQVPSPPATSVLPPGTLTSSFHGQTQLLSHFWPEAPSAPWRQNHPGDGELCLLRPQQRGHPAAPPSGKPHTHRDPARSLTPTHAHAGTHGDAQRRPQAFPGKVGPSPRHVHTTSTPRVGAPDRVQLPRATGEEEVRAASPRRAEELAASRSGGQRGLGASRSPSPTPPPTSTKDPRPGVTRGGAPLGLALGRGGGHPRRRGGDRRDSQRRRHFRGAGAAQAPGWQGLRRRVRRLGRGRGGGSVLQRPPGWLLAPGSASGLTVPGRRAAAAPSPPPPPRWGSAHTPGVPSASERQTGPLSGQMAMSPHRGKTGLAVVTSGNVKQVSSLALTASGQAGAETQRAGPAPPRGQRPEAVPPGPALPQQGQLCSPERVPSPRGPGRVQADRVQLPRWSPFRGGAVSLASERSGPELREACVSAGAGVIFTDRIHVNRSAVKTLVPFQKPRCQAGPSAQHGSLSRLPAEQQPPVTQTRAWGPSHGGAEARAPGSCPAARPLPPSFSPSLSHHALQAGQSLEAWLPQRQLRPQTGPGADVGGVRRLGGRSSRPTENPCSPPAGPPQRASRPWSPHTRQLRPGVVRGWLVQPGGRRGITQQPRVPPGPKSRATGLGQEGPGGFRTARRPCPVCRRGRRLVRNSSRMVAFGGTSHVASCQAPSPRAGYASRDLGARGENAGDPRAAPSSPSCWRHRCAWPRSCHVAPPHWDKPRRQRHARVGVTCGVARPGRHPSAGARLQEAPPSRRTPASEAGSQGREAPRAQLPQPRVRRLQRACQGSPRPLSRLGSGPRRRCPALPTPEGPPVTVGTSRHRGSRQGPPACEARSGAARPRAAQAAQLRLPGQPRGDAWTSALRPETHSHTDPPRTLNDSGNNTADGGGGMKNRTLLLTVLEAGSSRSRCRQFRSLAFHSSHSHACTSKGRDELHILHLFTRHPFLFLRPPPDVPSRWAASHVMTTCRALGVRNQKSQAAIEKSSVIRCLPALALILALILGPRGKSPRRLQPHMQTVGLVTCRLLASQLQVSRLSSGDGRLHLPGLLRRALASAGRGPSRGHYGGLL